MTLKTMLQALSAEDRAALKAEAELTVGHLTEKINQATMARDFALGYAVILTQALQQIDTEEQAAEARSLVEKVRQNLAEGSMAMAQS